MSEELVTPSPKNNSLSILKIFNSLALFSHKCLVPLLIVVSFLYIPLSHADDEIKIGAIFAKTGEAAEENLVIFQALRYAVEEVNNQGGLLGKKVRLLEYDNHSTPIQSLLAAKKAVKDGVIAVIGASWSTHSLAMAPFLQKMKIPMISPDSTNAKVTLIGDYIFRACITDDWQGTSLANFAIKKLNSKKAVIMQNINSDYSIGLTDIFQKEFTSHGGNIVGVFNYKAHDADFTSQLEKIKPLSPDLIFIPGYAESGYIVKQLQDMNINATPLGSDTWSYKEFYVHGGQDLKLGYYTAHWNKNLDTDKAQKFVERYHKIYAVTDFAATAYDAAWILFSAIKKADTDDRQSIRDAMAKTTDFNGVTGKISFNENGDAQKQMIMMKITDGRAHIMTTIMPK